MVKDNNTTQMSLWDAQPDFDKSIRRIEQKGIVYFSLVDIMTHFSDSTNDARKYWSDTKKRLEKDGFDVSEKITRIKLKDSIGRMQLTDCADGQTCLRIVQSIPSPKAEPIRLWLAQLGYERIEETANPMLGLERAHERINKTYERQGRDEAWIEARFKGIVSRNLFTDTLKAVVYDNINFADATNAINVGLFDRTAHKLSKASGHPNARDGMTIPALNAVSSIEWTSAQLLGDRQSISFDEAIHHIREITRVYRVPLDQIQAMLGIDLATGKPLLGAGK